MTILDWICVAFVGLLMAGTIAYWLFDLSNPPEDESYWWLLSGWE